MLYIDICNSEKNETVRVGTLGEFVSLLVSEIGSVTTALTKEGFRKKSIKALDRVIQGARDNAKVK